MYLSFIHGIFFFILYLRKELTGKVSNWIFIWMQVVRWGRSVYANIQKFIQFQLTVNVAALIINVVAAVSSGSIPLNAVQVSCSYSSFLQSFVWNLSLPLKYWILFMQLLWVNLIMDTLGALALATEPPTNQLMRRAPVGRRLYIMDFRFTCWFFQYLNSFPDTNSIFFLIGTLCYIWSEVLTVNSQFLTNVNIIFVYVRSC